MQRTEEVTVALVVISCLLAFMAFPTSSMALSAGSPLWTRLTYPFAHASLLHLVLNCVFFCLAVSRYRLRLPVILLSFVVAASFPACFLKVPLVGLSGCVFFLIGTMLFRAERRWRFLRASLTPIAVAFIIPGISASCHLWCLTIGFIYSFFLCRKKS